jgi:hypothetical protein
MHLFENRNMGLVVVVVVVMCQLAAWSFETQLHIPVFCLFERFGCYDRLVSTPRKEMDNRITTINSPS